MTVVEAVHQYFPGFFFNSANLFYIFCCKGRGFLTKYVLTCFQALNSKRFIQVIGRTGKYRVNFGVFDDLIRVLCFFNFSINYFRIVYRLDLYVFKRRNNLMTYLTHLTIAYNSNFIHYLNHLLNY